MQILNNLSIKLRVSLLLGLYLLLLASLGLFTLQRISILHDLTETLYEHPLQVSNAALRAKTGIIRMHRSMKDVTLSKTQLELDLAIQRVLSDEEIVYQDLDIVKGLILGQEGKNLVEQTITMFAGWKPIRIEVEELVQAGKRDEASKITKQKGADYVAKLERQMNDLTSYAHKKADGFMADAKETHEQIKRVMIWIILAVIICCLGSAFLVVGGITQSIYKLQDKMATSVESGKLQHINSPGKNEFSKLAQHFNTLVIAIEEQLWLRDKLNELNKYAIGDISLSDLAKGIISFTTRTVEGSAGVLYLYDEESKSCVLQSSFAFVERNFLANSFKLGEGIVGQVALEKHPILLRNIQKEDALVLSGTTSESPVCIYAIPILYDQQLFGVMEIAFLEQLSPIRKQFIDEATQIIGGVFKGSLQNDRIKHLLTDSQAANSALRAKSLEVKNKNKELDALNNELKSQATELRIQKNELEVKRTQLEEADRLKSEFLSNMSHELRTPLNSILSLSQLLISRGVDADPKSATEYLHVIDRNGKHLLNLINDILDLTKIESGRMELYPTEFSLTSLITALKETVEPLALQKELEFQCDTPSDVILFTDREKVHQILLNFLSNAVKFTEKGTIQLAISLTRTDVLFNVIDQGIGIEQNDHDTIFDEFRQVDGSFTRAHDGTGLGLAICKKLSKLLKGTIYVKSNPGEGSTFTLKIPLALTKRSISTSLPVSFSYDTAPDNNIEGKTILVIDDDKDDRNEIVQLLKEIGYHAIEASSGEEGIKLAKLNQPDLICLDLIMPGVDGWEILNQLKAEPSTTAIPVIISSLLQEQETSMALGASGCIEKPVKKDKLIQLLLEISKEEDLFSILVIDDDIGVQKYLENLLNEQGYHVEIASNGAEALEKYDQKMVDLIILDLLMPVMDGYGFIQQIKERHEKFTTPIVVLTSKDLTAEDHRLLMGVQETITKQNLDKQLFLSCISKALSRKKEEKAVKEPKVPYILVIDDNDVAGEQIKIVLEEHGFFVRVAKDGEQGLLLLEESIPDGIILDLMMPEIDGFTVLEQIRSQRETVELPVLILTAKEITAEERGRLSHNNVQQLIQKGTADRDRLVSSVKRLLNLPQTSNTPPYPKKENGETILVVEDNQDNRYTITAILKEEGYDITFAVNGQEGVDKALTIIPDLILMDIQLPDLSGIEALKQIKADKRTNQIPIIALTAKAMKGDREEILNSGFNDYFPKPIEPIGLVKLIDIWLEKGRTT